MRVRDFIGCALSGQTCNDTTSGTVFVMPFGFRPDGDRVKGLAPTRAIMPFIFPTRTESQVFFEMLVDAAPARAFIADARASSLRLTLLHLVLAACARALQERPRLNRFV